MRHLTRATRPATKIMVVYSKATGVRRRVIDADNDDEYKQHEATLHSGEGFFYLTTKEYDSHQSPHELNHTTAIKAGFLATLELHEEIHVDVTVHHPQLGDYSVRTIDRHDIVDPNGKVVGACHADPTCGDSGEHFALGHQLVHNPSG